MKFKSYAKKEANEKNESNTNLWLKKMYGKKVRKKHENIYFDIDMFMKCFLHQNPNSRIQSKTVKEVTVQSIRLENKKKTFVFKQK